jgi:DNA-binding MarR family transcriptional regulator
VLELNKKGKWMIEREKITFDKAHTILLERLQQMVPGESTEGIELVNLMRMDMHFIEAMLNQHPRLGELSGPRMGILMRLMTEEEMGNHMGINPTRLSHYQNVKKNTVSSLLSGLEEQGLIERTINPDDKRGFNIRITPAGKELILSSAPERIRFLNQITSGLTNEEKLEMNRLLLKLRTSLMKFRHNDGPCVEPKTL